MFAADPPAIAASAEAADHSDVIEIVGTRSGQALKIDRRTYEVQQNAHTQQKDSIQLLRGLPAVTISPEEDISLLGSGNVRIFVDGRPYSADPKSFLRSLHGSDIERIEIITNPSAQYSAEGTAGIINFVLRKKQQEGTSGNVSTELTSLGHGYFDGTLKTKRGRLTYEFHAGGRAGTSWRSTDRKLRSTEEVPGENPTISRERGRGRTRGTEGEGSAKLSYELDQRTSVSAKILAAYARDVSPSRSEFAGLTPDFESFTEHQRLSSAAPIVITELNFDHKGKKDGETLGSSLRIFSNSGLHETNDSGSSNGAALSTDKQKRFLFVDSQIDWQHPMAKGQILSVGASWDYARMSERYSFESVGTGGALGSDTSDQFKGVDNKFTAYATFQQPIGGWTLMPGLRVEHDSRQVSSPGRPTVHVSRTEVFQTLHIDRPLSKTLNLTLSYSKRVDRPQLNDLRPYPLVQDVLTIKLGNPHLKDQSTDAYEINLHYHLKKVDAGVIVYDRETSRMWNQTYAVIPGTNIFTSSTINSGRSRDRGAEFDLTTPILRRVKLTASVNLFDQRMPAGTVNSDTSAAMFRYTTNGTLEWDGPEHGKTPGDIAQLQWIYNSPWRQFQVHYLEWNQLTLSYTHSFSRTVSLTGTAVYYSLNRHRLVAPLVQEYYSAHYPTRFTIKLLKTFGSSK
jgi:outer membrane receptor protein involved in Fe transport